MSFESGLSFFIAIFIFGITPGPGVFAILAKAMTEGVSRCTLLAFGMTISDAIYLVLACFGLATLAQLWAEAFIAIRIIGACYLLYLGYKMFTAPMLQPQEQVTAGQRGNHLLSFIQGLLISASNPKVILFYIAFLPTFMDLTQLSNQDIVVAVMLTIVALMAGLMLIAYSAAKASKLLKTPSAVRQLNRGAGSLMIGAGLYLAARN